MVRKASEDIGKGELLFSPLPGQDRSQEPDAWQVGSVNLLCKGTQCQHNFGIRAFVNWEPIYSDCNGTSQQGRLS